MGVLITLKDLTPLLEKTRRDNGKVVFTNGCFDILHAGHTRYLEEARAFGDILVVGLNSDKSIKSIKGNKRPIVEEAQRAEVLAALRSVDYVVLFDEDTPARLIETVKPDILVKGEDWSEDEITGKDFVEACGGRVARVPLAKGISTTAIVEKIKRLYCDG